MDVHNSSIQKEATRESLDEEARGLRRVKTLALLKKIIRGMAMV